MPEDPKRLPSAGEFARFDTAAILQDQQAVASLSSWLNANSAMQVTSIDAAGLATCARQGQFVGTFPRKYLIQLPAAVNNPAPPLVPDQVP